MKRTSSLLALAATSLFAAASAQAQTIVTFVGITESGQEPGSASDFINFTPDTYPTGGPSVNHFTTTSGIVYSNLNSFTIQGGVRAEDAANYSVVTNPEGQSVLTGAVVAEPGLSIALSPGTFSGKNLVLNPNFNYNNFNVYLMFSNTNGNLTSNGVAGGIQQDAVISLDPRGGTTTVPFGTHDQNVTDNTNEDPTINPLTAQFIEFNVTGLGTTLAANPDADLVISANQPDGIPYESYIGGVFIGSNSVPEPSTYAMLLGGVAARALLVRARGMLKA